MYCRKGYQTLGDSSDKEISSIRQKGKLFLQHSQKGHPPLFWRRRGARAFTLAHTEENGLRKVDSHPRLRLRSAQAKSSGVEKMQGAGGAGTRAAKRSFSGHQLVKRIPVRPGIEPTAVRRGHRSIETENPIRCIDSGWVAAAWGGAPDGALSHSLVQSLALIQKQRCVGPEAGLELRYLLGQVLMHHCWARRQGRAGGASAGGLHIESLRSFPGW